MMAKELWWAARRANMQFIFLLEHARDLAFAMVVFQLVPQASQLLLVCVHVLQSANHAQRIGIVWLEVSVFSLLSSDC